MSGDGYLAEPMPANAAMSEITEPDLGGLSGRAEPLYAFATDSAREEPPSHGGSAFVIR